MSDGTAPLAPLGADTDPADTDTRRLGHLVYDAALDNSLWPELILTLTEQLRRAPEPGRTPADDAELADLAAHFRRALMISERMVDLQEKASVSSALLDTLTVGIALIGAGGRVTYTNAAFRGGPAGALLASEDGAAPPRLAPPEGGEARPLSAWLRDAAATGAPARLGGGPHAPGGDLLLLPRETAMRLGFPPSADGVLLSGGGWEADAMEEFAERHDLTPREADMTRALAMGGDLRAAAGACGVTYESARTYMKRVYEKTGCGGQAALLAALARSPLAALRPRRPDPAEGLDVRRLLTLRDGRRMEAFVLGPPDGRPVVLFEALAGVTIDVLGYPRTCLRWLERHGVRLVTPCRPGNFKSDPKEMRGLTGIAPDIGEMLDQLGIDRVSILSVSFGSGAALAAAHEMPGRVERVVLSAATYPAYRPPNWRGLDQFHQMSSVLARKWPALFRQVLPFLIRSVVQNPDRYFDRYCRNARSEDDREILSHPTMRRRIPDMLSQRSANGMEGMIAENILNAAGWDFEPSRIETPVEMHHGALDTVSPPAAAEALAAALPNAALNMMAGRGHYLHVRDWPWMLARAAGRDAAPGGARYEIPDGGDG